MNRTDAASIRAPQGGHEATRSWQYWLLRSVIPGVLLLLGLTVVSGARAEAADEAVAKVRESTDELVRTLNNERQTYYSDPEKFYRVMEASLVAVVDFERIAARVMGKYRRQASDAQKEAFVEAFKRSLFRAYGKTLVESGEFQVSVLGGETNPREADRANVNLEVTSSSGNKYPIVYAMYRNQERGWLLENVIVNGVNVGLAFRDKFEQQYTQLRGDLDAVVAGWSTTIDENALQAEQGKPS